ncbi:MAG: hypothetical protein AB1508_09760 [Pseudomonadota bacterium]
MRDDNQEYADARLSPATIKALIAIIAVYLFFCGFIFAVCVFMSNADMSPEISLDLPHHPVKSILLVALVAIPFLLMVAIGRGGKWTWLGLRLFAIVVMTAGIYAMAIPHGLLEGFTGVGGLREGMGLVYAASSALVVLIAAIPGLRQRLAEGL